MINPKTIKIHRQDVAEAMAEFAVAESIGICIEPLPDDEWEITVENYNVERAMSFLSSMHWRCPKCKNILPCTEDCCDPTLEDEEE